LVKLRPKARLGRIRDHSALSECGWHRILASQVYAAAQRGNGCHAQGSSDAVNCTLHDR